MKLLRSPEIKRVLKAYQDAGGQIGRIVGWSPKDVAAMRARYVDEARVVIELSKRIAG